MRDSPSHPDFLGWVAKSGAGKEVEDLWDNGDFIQSQSVLGGSSSAQVFFDVLACDVVLDAC